MTERRVSYDPKTWIEHPQMSCNVIGYIRFAMWWLLLLQTGALEPALTAQHGNDTLHTGTARKIHAATRGHASAADVRDQKRMTQVLNRGTLYVAFGGVAKDR